MQVFEVFGDLIFRDDNVESRMNRINDVVDRANERMVNIGNAMSNVGAGLMGLGSRITSGFTIPLVNAIKDSISTASDLNEAYNVVDTTFGNNSKVVKDWSKTLMDKFGLVQLEAINYVGSMGAMLKSSGLSTKASQDMSQSLVELTGDMSSFYNLSHEETWEKLRAGISGETEPLKSLGINMSVANLEAFALTKGIKKSWKEMSQAEQTTLRYNYLMSVTKDVQGDFAKTSDSLSNRIRILGGRFTEMKTKLGEQLLPYANKAVEIALKLVSGFQKLPSPIQKVILVITVLVGAIGPAIGIIGGLTVAAGAVVTAIGAIGAPVFAVVAGIGALIAIFAAAGVAVVAFMAKTGVLQTIIKNVRITAGLFIEKLKTLKGSLNSVKTVIQNVAKVIMTIFTGNTDRMIKLLISKFGYSRKEAVAFANKVKDLRTKVAEMAEKVRSAAAVALSFFITTIKKAAQFVYDHRKAIMKAIEAIVSFGSKSLTAIKKIISIVKSLYSAFQTAKSKISSAINTIKSLISGAKTTINSAFESIKGKIDKVKNAFNYLKDAASNAISKIKNIKFPSVPSWVPGFAEGVRNFGGGLAMVGEKGPELVKLPRGADVIPASEVKSYTSKTKELKNISSYKKTVLGSDNRILNLNMYNQIYESVDIDKFMNKVVDILKVKGLVVRNGG